MGKVYQQRDRKGGKVYPVTLSGAVITPDGRTIQKALEDEASQTQEKVTELELKVKKGLGSTSSYSFSAGTRVVEYVLEASGTYIFVNKSNSILQIRTKTDNSTDATTGLVDYFVIASNSSFLYKPITPSNYLRIYSSGAIDFEVSVEGEIRTDIRILEGRIGQRFEKEASVKVGETVNIITQFNSKKGDYYSIYAHIPRGLTTNNAYNVSLLKELNGTNKSLIYSGTLPEDYILQGVAEYDVYGVVIDRSASGVVATGTISISIDATRFATKAELVASSGGGVVYVDATNGNDDNNGTSNDPFKTFRKAIESTGADSTIILRGEINEPLNISTKVSQKSITLIGEEGKNNRIVLGTKITSATQYSGDVYYKVLESFSSADYYNIYQHGILDERTRITESERHPLHRGKTHRCDSTKLIKVTSIQAVVQNENLAYFWDSSAKRLYFKIANGSDLQRNPIILPNVLEDAIYGNNGRVALHIVNVDAYYGCFNISRSNGAIVENCAAKYAISAGCFRWDDSVGVKLIQCEATGALNGVNGDGFNAHSSVRYATNDPTARHTTCTMIDCWSHDNNDDGYSDHERCECSIHGGLFEYNKKGGVTPAYGSHLVAYNVTSRRNNNGFYYTGEATGAEGGVYGQMICVNCFAIDNTVTAGFMVDGVGNKMELVNCKSIGNPTGYRVYGGCTAKLVDCTSHNDSTIKATSGDGSITIENTQIVG